MKDSSFQSHNYDYKIPPSLIAQEPTAYRDNCRLLVLNRRKKSIKEAVFKDIGNFLNPGDTLVLNNTKVIMARLLGVKETGAKLKVLLLKELSPGLWQSLIKPSKRIHIGDAINFEKGNSAKVISKTQSGLIIIKFNSNNIKKVLPNIGKVPTPPYIKKEVKNINDYQTVYAKKEGAVAAPTAGLHFTQSLLRSLKRKGINVAYITLHCGLATFRPLKVTDIRAHKIDSESIEISSSAKEIITASKGQGKKVFAVGTTTVRALESAANFFNSSISNFSKDTNLYIVPGYKFKVVDSLITNFHTPLSTNLVMASAFAGLDFIKRSYNYAKENNFRFFSFGDAMLIE